MKNNKTFVIISVVGVLVCLIVLLTTYAFWTYKEKQTNVNVITTGCLSINYNELSEGIRLENAWPTSDQDGINSTGYSFSIENICDEEATYQIVLESIPTTAANYMDYDNIKIQLDNGPIYRYEELVDEDDDPEAMYDIRNTKHVSNGVVMPGETDNHVIRIWLASDAPLDARGQEFNGKVKVFAGQVNEKQQTKYADASCFTITDDGTLTGYDIENDDCPADLVIPASINGITVKTIGGVGFLGKDASYLTNLDISNMYGLEKISAHSFWNISGYVGSGNDLVIPESVNVIGTCAFSSYNGQSLTLPKEMQSIGSHAFMSYVGSNQDLVIPKGIETIQDNTFFHFNGTSISFPDSVKHINDYAFDWYRGDDLVLPTLLETIKNYAFAQYVGQNSKLVIPNTVSTIGERAFQMYRGPQLVMSNSIVEIGPHAFPNYNSTDIKLPGTITTIGDNAFYSMGQDKKIIMDMTPEMYANVIKGDNWNGDARIVCIQNNTEVPCE